MRAERLNLNLIKSRLSEGAAGCTLFYRDAVDSTNEWAKRDANEGAADRSIYFAEKQTAGKGRRGRSWQSPVGSSVAMSVLLRLQIPPEDASMLTLVMGLAAAEGLKEVSSLETCIKWPNDVVVGGKKLCGILTEMNSRADYVVIGIGININVPSFPEELKETATSLYIAGGREIQREAAAAAVISHFFADYETFVKTRDLSGLRGAYEAMLANKGRQVRVLDRMAPYCGVAEGINDKGELLVRREDGSLGTVFAGEVSVRGIYGYV